MLSIKVHFSNEIKDIISEKIAMLKAHYLTGFPEYGNKINAYLKWLGENVIEWKYKYADWLDVYRNEFDPYILQHFTEQESCTESTEDGFPDLYSCMFYVCEYIDLHD